MNLNVKESFKIYLIADERLESWIAEYYKMHNIHVTTESRTVYNVKFVSKESLLSFLKSAWDEYVKIDQKIYHVDYGDARKKMIKDLESQGFKHNYDVDIEEYRYTGENEVVMREPLDRPVVYLIRGVQARMVLSKSKKDINGVQNVVSTKWYDCKPEYYQICCKAKYKVSV